MVAKGTDRFPTSKPQRFDTPHPFMDTTRSRQIGLHCAIYAPDKLAHVCAPQCVIASLIVSYRPAISTDLLAPFVAQVLRCLLLVAVIAQALSVARILVKVLAAID